MIDIVLELFKLTDGRVNAVFYEYENEILTVPDEDRPHIFWACPTVFDTISYVLSNFGVKMRRTKKLF